MIDYDRQLKIQACLDGELSAAEEAEVKVWLEQDESARALMGELRNTRGALAGNEAEVKLPESPDFFWSKIQRDIQRLEKAPAPARPRSWLAWIHRPLRTLSAIGGLAVIAVVFALHSGGVGAAQFGEMELASDDMGAFTFRDQQAKMTLVWFYNRDDGSAPVSASSLDAKAE